MITYNQLAEQIALMTSEERESAVTVYWGDESIEFDDVDLEKSDDEWGYPCLTI